MLLNRIYEPVNALLRPEQAGFRRGRSCTLQIHILSRITEGFHKKQLPLISTSVDFKKAFDSVDRARLSEILRNYGIPEKIVTAIMEMYKETSSKVMVNGEFSKLFYITKGVLQGDTLAPFLFIIVLDYVLKVTELGNFGIQTHAGKTLHDLDFADDIVLLDSDSERANEHITCLKENAGYVGLNINFKKTKVWFLGCEPAPLVVQEEEVAPVEDFCYLGSMISSPLDDLRRRRGMAWSAFWKLETVWRSQPISLETKLSLFNSLVLSVMLYGAETWPISTQINQLINSFATSAYRIMTGVKRLDKVRNTMVL